MGVVSIYIHGCGQHTGRNTSTWTLVI